jgi:hypothetical protein
MEGSRILQLRRPLKCQKSEDFLGPRKRRLCRRRRTHRFYADTAVVRETASAAHIHDKPIVATESFTSMPNIPAWGPSPFYLKPLADRHFAMGVNRIVFHISDQQPFVDDAHKPGITLWMFGQHKSLLTDLFRGRLLRMRA